MRVSEEQCTEAAWAVDAAGASYRGAGAMNAALAAALGTRLPLRLYGLPMLRWIEDRVYDLVARLRGFLPGIEPYCVKHPEGCE